MNASYESAIRCSISETKDVNAVRAAEPMMLTVRHGAYAVCESVVAVIVADGPLKFGWQRFRMPWASACLASRPAQGLSSRHVCH